MQGQWSNFSNGAYICRDGGMISVKVSQGLTICHLRACAVISEGMLFVHTACLACRNKTT